MASSLTRLEFRRDKLACPSYPLLALYEHPCIVFYENDREIPKSCVATRIYSEIEALNQRTAVYDHPMFRGDADYYCDDDGDGDGDHHYYLAIKGSVNHHLLLRLEKSHVRR